MNGVIFPVETDTETHILALCYPESDFSPFREYVHIAF
jgi:hypothetical protein